MTLVLPEWDDARASAHASGRRLPSESVPIAAADRRVLATDVTALTALPSCDASAMDGWAVSGAGPWTVGTMVRAGQLHEAQLVPGHAVPIATGAAVPAGTTGVLRSEDGRIDAGGLLHGQVREQQDIRPAGEEARLDELLIAAGTTLGPAHLGLAAAAGHDALTVVRRPRARVLVLGDELLQEGPARHGKVRDSLGAQVPAWLERMGCDVVAVDWVPDTREAHTLAFGGTDDADLVVTSGGTAAGPVDYVRAGLSGTGGALVVEGVDVRPGSPMVLGRWPDGRVLIGLPGNPQAAIVALMTLGLPVVDAFVGRPLGVLGTRRMAGQVASRGDRTRLVPCAVVDGDCSPVNYIGSGMLRGLAAADGFAVVPGGQAAVGDRVRWLPLP
jgi:molybdopterin molybdotransferase